MNYLTYHEIENIIDNHFNSETNLLFVCDRELAEHICNYVLEEYELFDDDVEFPDNVDEYYVSIFFLEDEVNFYCEVARGCSGQLKEHDNEDKYIDYFIGIDVSEQEVDERLLGENATWSWVKVINEFDDDNDLEEYEDFGHDYHCEKCKEIRFYQLVADTLNRINDADGCPKCEMRAFLDFIVEFQDMGIRIGKV